MLALIAAAGVIAGGITVSVAATLFICGSSFATFGFLQLVRSGLLCCCGATTPVTQTHVVLINFWFCII